MQHMLDKLYIIGVSDRAILNLIALVRLHNHALQDPVALGLVEHSADRLGILTLHSAGVAVERRNALLHPCRPLFTHCSVLLSQSSAWFQRALVLIVARARPGASVSGRGA